MVAGFPSIAGAYVARQVLWGMFLVLVTLLALYTLIDILRELRGLDVGYGVVDVFAYVAQTTLRRAYEVFPFAALIGTLLGMGSLAASQELVALRAAGISRQKLAGMAVAGGVLLLAVVVVLAETLMPVLEADARTSRMEARTGQVELTGRNGLWLRDGRMLIRVERAVWVADEHPDFLGVSLYRLSGEFAPEELVHAERASHSGGRWVLEEIRVMNLDPEKLPDPVYHERLELDSGIDPAVFAAVLTRPRFLSAPDLIGLARYMEANGLDASAYRSAFWRRMFYPLSAIAMMLVGLPFVFRSSRQAGWGFQALIGIGLGLSFHVINRVFQGTAALVQMPSWLAAAAVPVLFILFALWLLRRRI